MCIRDSARTFHILGGQLDDLAAGGNGQDIVVLVGRVSSILVGRDDQGVLVVGSGQLIHAGVDDHNGSLAVLDAKLGDVVSVFLVVLRQVGILENHNLASIVIDVVNHGLGGDKGLQVVAFPSNGELSLVGIVLDVYKRQGQ